MRIEIEKTELTKNDFPNKNQVGERWYTASQPALLFRDGETYPDKFELSIVFSGNKSDQDRAASFKVGSYEFADKAFYINNRNQLALDSSRLVSLA